MLSSSSSTFKFLLGVWTFSSLNFNLLLSKIYSKKTYFLLCRILEVFFTEKMTKKYWNKIQLRLLPGKKNSETYFDFPAKISTFISNNFLNFIMSFWCFITQKGNFFRFHLKKNGAAFLSHNDSSYIFLFQNTRVKRKEEKEWKSKRNKIKFMIFYYKNHLSQGLLFFYRVFFSRKNRKINIKCFKKDFHRLFIMSLL